MLIGGIALCYFGGQDIYTGIRNLNPTSMTCAEYEAQRPDAEWLELRECVMQISELTWFSEDNRIVRAYVPLQTPGTGYGHRTPVVFATEDEHILDLIQRSDRNDEAATTELFAMGREPMTFSGLIEIGSRIESSHRSQLTSMSANVLTPDFVAMDGGETPSFVWGGLKLAGGLGLLGLFALAMLGMAGREGGAPA